MEEVLNTDTGKELFVLISWKTKTRKSGARHNGTEVVLQRRGKGTGAMASEACAKGPKLTPITSGEEGGVGTLQLGRAGTRRDKGGQDKSEKGGSVL